MTRSLAAASKSLAVALVGMAFAYGVAQAQPSGVQERQRIQELQAKQSLSATEYLKAPQRDYTSFDWGGWSSTSMYVFKDDDNSRATFDLFHNLLLTDFRIWTKVVTKGGLGVYVRAKKLHHTYDLGMGGVAPDSQNVDAFDLDVGFLDFALGPNFRCRIGRQLTLVGRGLALLDNLDSASLRYNKGAWAANAFYGWTPPLEDNLDTSVGPAGSGNAQRNFGGLEVSRTNTKGRRAYGYALLETDKTLNESGISTNLDHAYDVQFYGLGGDGPIRHKWVGYVEGILEKGRTLSQNVLLDANTSRDDVNARALIAAVQYLMGDKRMSVASLEYAYGSGDSDRGSTLNVLGAGNRAFTDDTDFNYFGYYDLGLALSPRLSNLEVWRLGYSFKPFLDRRGYPRDFQLGAKGTIYHKDTAQGAISATTATQANLGFEDVGSAADVFAAWKILTDMSLTVQWGRFWPGAAYSVGFNDPTDRLFMNLTQSF